MVQASNMVRIIPVVLFLSLIVLCAAQRTRRDCTPTSPDIFGPYYRPNPPPLEQKCPKCPDAFRKYHMRVYGRVYSDDCVTPLPDMLLEVWQADKAGSYDTAQDLRGQLRTDKNGYYEFTTVRPGNYKVIDGYRPAHIHYYLPERNGHRGLVTQMYFAGDRFLGRNDTCPICGSGNSDLITIPQLTCDDDKFCMDSVRFNIILAKGTGTSLVEVPALPDIPWVRPRGSLIRPGMQSILSPTEPRPITLWDMFLTRGTGFSRR